MCSSRHILILLRYGKAYKLFPIKRVFLLANAFSFLGSIICATAISSPMLVLGRAIAGVGAAGLSAGGNQMLVLSTPLQIRSKFLGMWSAIEGVTTIAGPLIGGAITDTIGWRWCFWINVPIGGATLLLTFLCFSETPKTGEVARLTFKEKIMQLDFVSTFLILPALTCLFLAFSWGGTTYPWSDGHVVGLIVTFAVLAAAFVYEQIRKGDKATIPIHILKRRNVIACVLFGMFQNSAGNTFEYYLPIYYQAARGYSPLESGYLMFPILVGATIAAVGTGFGISASGYYAPFMMFTSTAMTVAAGVVATFNTETGLAKLILITGLFGAGYGAGAPGPFIAVQAVLPQDEVPLGMAVLLFVYGFGPAVFITVAQVILSSQLTKNIHGLLPGLDSASIDAVGLTELVSKVPRAEWHEIYAAVSKSVVHTWYLVIVLAACTFLGSLMVEWRSIKNNADKTVEPTNQDMELAGASKEEKQSFEQK